jgi:hypothetical protein
VFGPEYWKKAPGLTARVMGPLLNGCGLRQAARILRVSPSTVRRHTRLLAKQCLLIHHEQLRRLAGRLREAVAHDGLRTFAGSQFEPLDLHTPVAVATGFLLMVNLAGLRRSGTMRPEQRRRRAARDERLGRPDPRGREKRTREILELIQGLSRSGAPVVLRTDEEPDYLRALRRPIRLHGIELVRVSSRLRRDARNPLWRVNVLHGYMRHASRGLARETIAFAKTAAGLLDRAWIFAVGQNNIKGVSERSAARSRITPAMLLGLASRPRTARALLARRRFPRRVGLPQRQLAAYLGTVQARPRERVKPYIHQFVA